MREQMEAIAADQRRREEEKAKMSAFDALLDRIDGGMK